MKIIVCIALLISFNAYSATVEEVASKRMKAIEKENPGGSWERFVTKEGMTFYYYSYDMVADDGTKKVAHHCLAFEIIKGTPQKSIDSGVESGMSHQQYVSETTRFKKSGCKYEKIETPK